MLLCDLCFLKGNGIKRLEHPYLQCDLTGWLLVKWHCPVVPGDGGGWAGAISPAHQADRLTLSYRG